MRYKVIPKKKRGEVLYYYIKIKNKFLWFTYWLPFRQFVDEDSQFDYSLEVVKFKSAQDALQYLKDSSLI